ncbi:MAG: hypothetical protein IJT23_04880 [Clostridia bacterium]|nr:hypothetical protein [Clostridia bacterium]
MAMMRDYLNEQLKNDEFYEEYKRLKPEFEIIQAVIDKKSNSKTLTQK